MTSPAHADSLLVISDFDGTLAGLSTEIYDVPVNTRSLAALTRLAGMPNTTVAVLSGRHLEGLSQVCDLREPIIRAGSHGNETSGGAGPSPEQQEELSRIEEALAPLFDVDGAFVERKPFQRVAHVAPLAAHDPEAATSLLDAAEALDTGAARVSRGKNIVEFSVTDVTKGTWISQTISSVEPAVAVFLGDDATDEDGFAVLRADDVGVKVGEGETRASQRVRGIEEAADWLTSLADDRAAHLGVPREKEARFEWISAGFSAVVLQVHDWSAPTPCEGWTASDIVAHILEWVPADAGVEVHVTGDPADDWFALVEALRGAESISGTVLTDIFIHTWDLAASQGVEAALDEVFAGKVLAGFAPLAEELRAAGRFGPATPVTEGAGALGQLLGATGRDPDWTPSR